MSALASERLKLSSTRTTVWLAAAMFGIVTLAAIVHLLGFEASLVDEASEQRSILTDIGLTMGLVFAAISGSLAITTEFRHGTIRPTLLKHPDRTGVLAAKLMTQASIGAVFAMSAAVWAVGLAAAFLEARGLALELGGEQIARLVAGGAVGGAAFAVGGLAAGTFARTQVPVVVGLLIWLLFIENLLRAGVPSIGRLAPGSLARAVAADGPATVTSPPLAALALVAAVTAGVAAARTDLTRRDIP